MKRVTRSRRVRSNIWRFGSDSDSSEENEDAYSSSNEKQPKKSLEKEPHKEDHGTSDWAGASGDPLDERSLRIDSSDEGEIVETESSPDRIPGALTRTNVSRDIATQSTNIFTNDVAVQTNVAKRNAALIDKGVQTEKPVAANIVEYMKDRLRNEDFMEGFKAAIELSEAFITKGQFLTLAGSYQGALTNIAPQAPLAIAAPFVQPQQLLQQQILRNFNPDANCFGQWSGQPAGNWAQPSRVVEPSSNFIPSPSFPNNHSFVVNPAHQGFAAAEPSPNFAPPQPFSNNHPFIANSALQGFAGKRRVVVVVAVEKSFLF
uniref:Uncharacterized protein n=1 Tax=Caenorhabditis japonica TaxID=281687 RepID=A0A8R1HM39_CAEJA